MTSTGATGTLVGSAFQIDAGSWFATQQTAPTGNFTAALTLGGNGALSGTLGQATFSPTAGIPFQGRLRFQNATLLSIRGWPLGELTQYAHVAFPTPAPAGLIRPATHGTTSWGFRGDAWHRGPVTQSQLTRSGAALPDAAAAGNVSVTAAGNVHVNLVSLSRIFASSLSDEYRLPLAARLELVLMPEPAVPALLLAGAAALAGLAERRRRTPRPH